MTRNTLLLLSTVVLSFWQIILTVRISLIDYSCILYNVESQQNSVLYRISKSEAMKYQCDSSKSKIVR
jgi:hypothetical protein